MEITEKVAYLKGLAEGMELDTEKKEGKLKKHDDVVIMDLPGIYSLSPYTLEEVVARDRAESTLYAYRNMARCHVLPAL